jgi:GntR family colanic acid and biofilm gene transcriptional regulator
MESSPAAKRRGRNQTTAPKFEPVDNASPEPVERQVYRSIRRGLMTGLVAPGASFTGRSLAQQLGVSAQPVRDALKRLEADGIVEGKPQSGFFLCPVTRKTYLELTQIRTRLEGLAGRLAAERIGPKTLASLQFLNDRMATAGTDENYLALNFDFHFAVYSASDMPTLLAIIENLWTQIGPVLNYHPHEFNKQEIVGKHKAIIDALARGDGVATEEAIAYDLNSAAEVIVRSLP